MKLLDRQEIPHRKAGTNRRIVFSDPKAYEERTQKARAAALDKLAEEGQAPGMGYE